jgi:hypothetical protein
VGRTNAQFLAALSRMSSVSGVKTHGIKIGKTLHPNFPLVSSTVVEAGQGVVYNVLVTDVYQAAINTDQPIEMFQSVYAPAVSFGCVFDEEAGQVACSEDVNVSGLVMCFILAIIGILIGLFGKRFFAICMSHSSVLLWFYSIPALFFYGFLPGTFLVYLVLGTLSSASYTGLSECSYCHV